jgi:hypothetical protein
MDSGLAAARRPGMTKKDCATNVTYEEKVTYGMSAGVIVHRDVIYGENVTYGPAPKLGRGDAGARGHAIDRAAAQFRNCRACSL